MPPIHDSRLQHGNDKYTKNLEKWAQIQEDNFFELSSNFLQFRSSLFTIFK